MEEREQLFEELRNYSFYKRSLIAINIANTILISLMIVGFIKYLNTKVFMCLNISVLIFVITSFLIVVSFLLTNRYLKCKKTIKSRVEKVLKK